MGVVDRMRGRTRFGRGATIRALWTLAVALALTACGDVPFQNLGWRSSEWINEPTVPTTIPVVTTIPTVVSTDQLLWANDNIETANLADHEALLVEVFGRRQGDRFIQASRFEIAVALPDVAFPAKAPSGAEWVSSQLVFNNDGTISDDPSAAFGIWSAEPYTRSRSVTQMAVLKVSTDPEGANELASGEADPSCARFSDRTTEECEILTVADSPVWQLTASSGNTLIWYAGPYRYELFGRVFVPLKVLQDMSGEMVPLASIGAVSS